MRFKNLERYRKGGTRTRMQLGIPLPKTPDGRVYRFSPNESAHPRHFVLGEADEDFIVNDAHRARMKQEPRSNKTVCPYSGTIADDGEFTHPDDVKAAIKVVEHAALEDIKAEFGKMFDGINRRQSRNALIKVKFSTDTRRRPMPRFARRDLLRELVCDHCGRDYGVYAIALFCPDCGAPNLRLHFGREVELVHTQVTLAEAQSERSEELAYRLLGNAHEDVLTAFEAALKAAYLHGAQGTPKRQVRNDFQNIEKTRGRFAEFGLDPLDQLSANEISILELNIQKRHIIGHNLGIMDSRFAEHSAGARVGETLHLVGEDIRMFADLSQRVVDRLDEWLVGMPTAAANDSGSNVPIEV